eukprot:CAMPEP_0115701068 /NCGR_PEP_ID=MMETSP0272-20121206/67755_1 /TAXON_ID=71861 /ORGANISM="Scrippsiella trochoidea, Strain CCMP3099" /LENGTH=183 /DNA_ID=CAMNT_0003141615 /DNA_START=32 /DNA_END=584 /DNA_ORIENTATION=+
MTLNIDLGEIAAPLHPEGGNKWGEHAATASPVLDASLKRCPEALTPTHWHRLDELKALLEACVPIADACFYFPNFRAGMNTLAVPVMRTLDLPRGSLPCRPPPLVSPELDNPADDATSSESRRALIFTEPPSSPKNELRGEALSPEASLPTFSAVSPAVQFLEVLGVHTGDGGGECAAKRSRP